MVKFAADYPGELPFMGWSIGRHDGYAGWKEQVDMAHTMAATHGRVPPSGVGAVGK
jgi:hypothetical protein